MRSLECYDDPRGFSLFVPAGWEQIVDPRPDTAFVAVDPDDSPGFRANLVVTIENLPPGLDFGAWQAQTEAALQTALHDYRLLDLEQLNDRPEGAAIRRLMHHVAAQAVPVTAEQWASARAGRGYTLTCTSATLAYDDLADALTDVGRSWRHTS